MRDLSTPQRVALWLAHAFSFLAVILVIVWATGEDTDDAYLGGLTSDWSVRSQASKVFNWHPVLMVTGMVFCFTEAVLTYRTFGFPKFTNKLIHLGWQSIGIIFISIGLRAVFKSHDLTNTANLYSLHSWLGIAVVTLFAANYLVGVVSFLIRLPSESQRREVLPYHVVVGISLFIMALFTVETGIVEKETLMKKTGSLAPICSSAYTYSELPSGCKLVNGLGVILVCIALSVAVAVMDVRKAGGTDDTYLGLPTQDHP